MRDKTRVCCGNAERVQVSQRDRGEAWVDFMSEQESSKKNGEGKRQAQRLLCKKAKGPFKYP